MITILRDTAISALGICGAGLIVACVVAGVFYWRANP